MLYYVYFGKFLKKKISKIVYSLENILFFKKDLFFNTFNELFKLSNGANCKITYLSMTEFGF